MQIYIEETYALLDLAIPIILTQMSQTIMGIADVIMSGSVSSTDMASVTLGGSVWLPVILLGHGLLLSLTPTISQLNGSGDRKLIPKQMFQGFWVSAFLSILIMIILNNSDILICRVTTEQILAQKSVSFLRYLMWGTPGYLFLQVLRCYCDGLSRTRLSMIIGFIGLIINIPMNFIFIHGKLGIKSLGGVGCGIATSIVHWMMFILMCVCIGRSGMINLPEELRKKSYHPDIEIIKNLLKLGLPISLSLFFEVTVFALVSLLVSTMGVIETASHQIAMNFSSLIFVVPLSISIAATVMVGFKLGEGKLDRAKISSRSSLVLGTIFSMLTAVLTLVFRGKISALYGGTPEIVSTSSHLILLTSLYQVSDSIQVIGNGILRGYKDTRFIFLITFVSHWLIGLPCGYTLALTDYLLPAMGPSGFWIGFIVGITISAVLMICRMIWLQNCLSDDLSNRFIVEDDSL